MEELCSKEEWTKEEWAEYDKLVWDKVSEEYGIRIAREAARNWHFEDVYKKKEKEMNEWKELDISEMPSDILSYENWEVKSYEGHIAETMEDKARIILQGIENCTDIYFRKNRPKTPTHEEIMTKWWKVCDGRWERVFCYAPEDALYKIGGVYEPVGYFTGRESADIPPEA